MSITHQIQDKKLYTLCMKELILVRDEYMVTYYGDIIFCRFKLVLSWHVSELLEVISLYNLSQLLVVLNCVNFFPQWPDF